jgi:hypothetical protein
MPPIRRIRQSVIAGPTPSGSATVAPTGVLNSAPPPTTLLTPAGIPSGEVSTPQFLDRQVIGLDPITIAHTTPLPDPLASLVAAATPTGSFPLRTDFQHGPALKQNVIVHQFADPSGKVEQRFLVGNGTTRYLFRRAGLANSERKKLLAFWESMVGPGGTFLYDVPQEDQTFVSKTVAFENEPLTLEDLADHICSVGITFVEIPDPSIPPSYPISATLERFPDSTLADALTEQEQEIIPLIRLRVIEAAVPDLLFSDRLCNVGGLSYVPRLLRIGDPGSDVLISQIVGDDNDVPADDVSFAFGNADRYMIQLANYTELRKARIEVSLYHVQSAIKLDLWAGEVVNWASDQGPEFTLQASDIISALSLQSPAGNISRTCWKIYGDINYGCPAVKQGPDDFCDLGYDTPNGCLVKQVPRSFGGAVVKPQMIQIKDNSTGGLFGFGRANITPTSQINDSIINGTLPEIWHNDDGIPQRGLSVQCRIADGREESDFYDALGIVGKGPIGAFTVAAMYDSDGDGKKETFLGATLDGQPHHGFKQTDSSGNFTDNNDGYRFAMGEDPALEQDYFSLGRVGDSTTDPREVVSGGLIFERNYAAGVAFIELRRTDQKGVQPSAISSHQMTAMISQGLHGVVWSAPGSFVDQKGCTNPFWVAVNTFLRSLGMLNADTKETYFDVDAAIACAAVADLTVPQLVGNGTEVQFRFKGTIDARKPLRDRLTEILNNCLGYYTWSFGKLKLGIRTSANPETYFNSGNMLFGSLKLRPLDPKFEKLTIEFADEEYLFTKNSVDYTDQDYALRNNRVQNPLNSQMGLIGSATKSQTSRLAVIRTREELGGVGASEQTAARNATWRSTILGLDTQAGKVVGIQDPDLVGGVGAFRIQSWRLNRDWSLDFAGKTVTDSMYDLTKGSVATSIPVIKQRTQADIDLGPPPAPVFLAQVAPDDPGAAEIHTLSFAQTPNTRTITSGTFTLTYHDPADPSVNLTKSFQTAFPYDFFTVDPLTSTYSTDEQQWMLKAHVPGLTGMVVTNIDAFVTNRYGNSEVTSLPVDLALSNSIDHWVFDETPAGAMDGQNRTYTLSATPEPPGSLILWRNGIRELNGIAYTLSGNVITYLPEVTDPPSDIEGESLRCQYRTA